jgi:CheY-like chemotaxis protein/anti-sigma regulatory factor (Ser/Thr protein kinase)
MGEIAPAKVLIVEDDSNDLNFLGKILSEENYKIFLATNGEEALKRAFKVIPDLILLDVMMPGLSGFEVCERLKKDPKTMDIPIVFLTGKTDSESIIHGFEVGGADYLTKPFNSAELLARVFTHIKLVRNTSALAKRILEINQIMQMVSHDLSNQIFGISGILEIVDSGIGDTEIKNYVPMLQNAADNSMAIVELIKELVFFEDKMQDWDLSSVVLKKSLVAAIEPLVVKFKDKKIVVNWDDIPDDLCVLAHERSLTQSVLPNVLSNAYKFSHQGDSIEIKAQVEGDKVKLKVIDKGIGVPKEYFPKLFTYDKTILQKGTLGETSIGYGLPLIKKFMDAYGGSVEYVSPPPGQTVGTECILTFNLGYFTEANL